MHDYTEGPDRVLFKQLYRGIEIILICALHAKLATIVNNFVILKRAARDCLGLLNVEQNMYISDQWIEFSSFTIHKCSILSNTGSHGHDFRVSLVQLHCQWVIRWNAPKQYTKLASVFCPSKGKEVRHQVISRPTQKKKKGSSILGLLHAVYTETRRLRYTLQVPCVDIHLASRFSKVKLSMAP